MIGTLVPVFDDAAARGARGVVAGEDREVVHAASSTSRAGPSTMTPATPRSLAPSDEVAAPAGGVDAGALLDDDHVARLRRFDGGRAEMPRRRGPAVVLFQLDGDHAARRSAGRSTGDECR